MTGNITSMSVVPSSHNAYTVGNHGSRFQAMYMEICSVFTRYETPQGYFQPNGAGIQCVRQNTRFEVLNLAGSAYAPVSASAFTQSSDQKLKENIESMTEEYAEQIYSLAPVLFNFIGADERQVGFIAQQVKPLFPEIVSETELDGKKLLCLNYVALTAIIIKAMQVLKETTEARLTALEQQIGGR